MGGCLRREQVGNPFYDSLSRSLCEVTQVGIGFDGNRADLLHRRSKCEFHEVQTGRLCESQQGGFERGGPAIPRRRVLGRKRSPELVRVRELVMVLGVEGYSLKVRELAATLKKAPMACRTRLHGESGARRMMRASGSTSGSSTV